LGNPWQPAEDRLTMMTYDGLRECCDTLGWGAGTLARQADVNLMTARRWLNGERQIPEPVATALETMAAAALTLSRRESE
jgi:hypothetical protein